MITEKHKKELLELQTRVNSLVDELVTKPEEHIQEIEASYISVGNTKILIVIPTEKKLTAMPPVLEKLITPSGCQIKYYNVYGLPVAEAYNNAVRVLLQDGADYMLTIEDDTFPPDDALSKLLSRLKTDKLDAVGAWYPKKNRIKEGVHICIGSDGKRSPLLADGKLHEVYTLAMGCTLYKTDMFKYSSDPWFATTENLTQDSFFSEKARKMGYKLWCDTSIKCKHVDRETGKVFE